uniref:Uncharacterized protein n=1 Tax=Salix viminalis TaxID=40686 RepID=A0A6N2K895_SALVM
MGEEGRHLNHMHGLESFEKQTNLGRDTCSLLQQLQGTEDSAYIDLLRLFAYGTWRDYKEGLIKQQLPEERKFDLLKALAEISPFTLPQDSRQVLPSVVQLLKKYMPRRKSGEEMNFTYVECLLYVFHHLAHKAPNATNSLCGYKIVTGQPSDRLGEDFSEFYTDLIERLSNVEDLTRATMRKLTQGMTEHNKAMAAAKSDDAKDSIKTQKQNTTTGLRTCNNILAMAKPLHAKTPLFIGDKSINLSWKEVAKPSVPSTTVSAGEIVVILLCFQSCYLIKSSSSNNSLCLLFPRPIRFEIRSCLLALKYKIQRHERIKMTSHYRLASNTHRAELSPSFFTSNLKIILELRPNECSVIFTDGCSFIPFDHIYV